VRGTGWAGKNPRFRPLKGPFGDSWGNGSPGKAMPPAPGKSQIPAGEKSEHAFPERLFLVKVGGNLWRICLGNAARNAVENAALFLHLFCTQIGPKSHPNCTPALPEHFPSTSPAHPDFSRFSKQVCHFLKTLPAQKGRFFQGGEKAVKITGHVRFPPPQVPASPRGGRVARGPIRGRDPDGDPHTRGPHQRHRLPGRFSRPQSGIAPKRGSRGKSGSDRALGFRQRDAERWRSRTRGTPRRSRQVPSNGG
jgi:hypothetical protein